MKWITKVEKLKVEKIAKVDKVSNGKMEVTTRLFAERLSGIRSLGTVWENAHVLRTGSGGFTLWDGGKGGR